MVSELIKDLKTAGITLTADGERLLWVGEKGRMTPALLAQVRARKADLIAYIGPRDSENTPQNFTDSIIQGDCLEAMTQIPDAAVDAIVTDPPYGYGFMGKDWDKALPGIEAWLECLRVLKPGAFAFIFAAPRQDVLSRMIVKLEDAGFVTGFSSIYWTYANGFPKAHNISKAVDRKLGADRVVVGEKTMPDMRGNNYGQGHRSYTHTTVQYTLPATAEAKALDGSYAGFQPKPAVEVILVVMKPLDQKNYTEQALATGKGITWLDDCRIPYGNELPPTGNRFQHDHCEDKPQWHQKCGVQWSPEKQWRQDVERQAHEKGRFPANLLVSDDVLDIGPDGDHNREWQKVDEKAGYSRFFSLDAWAERNRPFLIVPKAGTAEKEAGLDSMALRKVEGRDQGQDERNVSHKTRPSTRRNTHPTVKPLKLMTYLVTMGSRPGDIVLDPFAGSGSTLIAAQALDRRFIGIELEQEYFEIAKQRLSHHSALKAQQIERSKK